jgi:hypothetical protein
MDSVSNDSTLRSFRVLQRFVLRNFTHTKKSKPSGCLVFRKELAHPTTREQNQYPGIISANIMENKLMKILFSSCCLLQISLIFCIFVPYVIFHFLYFYVSFGALKLSISNSLLFFSRSGRQIQILKYLSADGK